MKNRVTKVGWFFYDPKYKTVLLHRRDHRAPESENVWDCFGGSIENDEKQEKALLREIQEEMDIIVPEQELILLESYKKFPVYYLYLHDWLTRIIRLGEGAGFSWFPINIALKLNDLTDEAKEILSEFKKLERRMKPGK